RGLYRAEHQGRAVGMLVREVFVEAAGSLRLTDSGYFPDLGCVGQSGDIENDGAEVHVRAALLELEALQEVVPAFALHVHRAQGAGPAVNFRFGNGPIVDDLRFAGVLDIDDPESGGREAVTDVDVGP